VFNSLYGTISGHRFPLVFLRTGGMEWQLEVSAATFQSVMNTETDGDHRVFTYLHSREDLLRLYGFWTEAERRAFMELISVPGIGPRQALKILSGTTPDSLVRYLDEEDIPALTRIPGLGKKTAQRLILQLKGHLVLDPDGTGAGAAGAVVSASNELLEALTEMGFDRKRAEVALKAAEAELSAGAGDSALPNGQHGRDMEQELFRRAIVALSGS
jgi:holliday junction DNA helicase RuvA